MRIILASPEAAAMQDFVNALEQESATVLPATSDQELLSLTKNSAPQAVLLDERLQGAPSLELLRELLMIDAMIGVAIFSDKSEDDFEEFYEGYGVLMPLPFAPGTEDATRLAAKIRAVQL